MRALIGFAALAMTQLALGQDESERLQTVLARTAVSVKGAERPDEIPLHWKMFWFLRVFAQSAPNARPTLSEADDAAGAGRSGQRETGAAD